MNKWKRSGLGRRDDANEPFWIDLVSPGELITTRWDAFPPVRTYSANIEGIADRAKRPSDQGASRRGEPPTTIPSISMKMFQSIRMRLGQQGPTHEVKSDEQQTLKKHT